MAREFARGFYRSKAWQGVRAYIMKRDGYVCRCPSCEVNRQVNADYAIGADEVHHIIHLTPKNIGDPRVTLDEKNLIAVSRDCHFAIHEESKRAGRAAADARKAKEDCAEEYYFDDDGVLRAVCGKISPP